MCLSARSMRSSNGSPNMGVASSRRARSMRFGRRPAAAGRAAGAVGAVATRTEPCMHVRASLADIELREQQRHGRALLQQRIYILAKQRVAGSDFKQLLLDLVTRCDTQRYTDADQLTGLYLYMEQHSLLVLEGSDDLLLCFVGMLAPSAADYWSASCVFHVEDQVQQVYFDTFVCRELTARAAADGAGVRIDDSDAKVMARHHWRLRRRLGALSVAVSRHVTAQEQPATDDILPTTLFERLRLDVSALELVLQAPKFYRNLQQYALMCTQEPLQFDEELNIWPKSDMELGTGVFQRSPYDVSLFFAPDKPQNV